MIKQGIQIQTNLRQCAQKINVISHYKCKKGRHQEVYQQIIQINQQLLMKTRYLEVRETQKMGKGMFAKDFISMGTIILIVGQKQFITYERLQSHSIFHKLINGTRDKMAEFAYFLAYHENLSECTDCNQEELSIKDYIQSLPKTYNNLICWENQELEVLNNPSLVDKIKKKKSKLEQSFQQINQVMLKEDITPVEQAQQIYLVQNKRGTRKYSHYQKVANTSNKTCLESLMKITIEQMSQFVASIESRNVHYQNGQDITSEVGALIPFLQMINHSKNPNCSVESTAGKYKIRAIQDIEKDEEIFVNYDQGYFSHEDFLEYYGIVQQCVTTSKPELAKIYNSIKQKSKSAIKKLKKLTLSQQN